MFDYHSNCIKKLLLQVNINIKSIFWIFLLFKKDNILC